MKRFCLLCGATLSEWDRNGQRICIGDEEKKGCGLVYYGEKSGIGEGEHSIAESLSRVFERFRKEDEERRKKERIDHVLSTYRPDYWR